MIPMKFECEEEDEQEINRLLFGIMNGYTDFVLPPLEQLPPLYEAIGVVEEGSSSRKRSRSEITLITERERRGKISESYDVLRSMIPNFIPKASKENIVMETIKYIKDLEGELGMLKESVATRERLTRSTDWNSSVNVTESNNVVFFGIQSLARQSSVTQIFVVFQRHKAEIMAANVAVNNGQLTVTVTAIVNNNGDNIIEKIKSDILQMLEV